jgi:NADH-quinone oxidoreductase subunit C
MADPESAVAEDPAPDETAEPEVELAHGVPVTVTDAGQRVLHPSREQLLDTVRALRADGFLQLLDVIGVDYLTHPGRTLPYGVTAERFEVVSLFLDHAARRRVRIRVQVPGDEPTIPSLFAIHPGAEAPEREAYDLFGIVFEGHPDMTRILLPDDWEGHPLRKDYAIGKIPVQFKGAPT